MQSWELGFNWVIPCARSWDSGDGRDPSPGRVFCRELPSWSWGVGRAVALGCPTAELAPKEKGARKWLEQLINWAT